LTLRQIGIFLTLTLFCQVYDSVVTPLLKLDMKACDQNCNTRNETQRKRLSLHTLSLSSV